jgi:hypothetical protein
MVMVCMSQSGATQFSGVGTNSEPGIKWLESFAGFATEVAV